MPRLPVDGKKVIEHRITFGTIEREALQSFVTANSFSKVATPLVNGMSDVSFMIVVAAILTRWFPDIVVPTGATTMEEVTESISFGMKMYQEGKDIKEAEGAGDTALQIIDFWAKYFTVPGLAYSIGKARG